MELDPDEAAAQARLGGAVGGWRLERVLGIGGMASVFLARRGDGATGAVKVLHAYLAGHHDLRKRFLREGPIGSALAAVGPLCEGLPQVLESGTTDDGSPYLVLEVLEGETVFDRMARSGAMPISDALYVAERVLDVLVIAHAHGIIHRDIKPENIHLGREWRVKLLDFGVARVEGELPDGGRLPDKTSTRTGTAIGSGQYMAPEQATGSVRDADGRTDLFGLGATLHHMVSGQPIHGALADARLLVAAATRRAAPLSTTAPALPKDVCDVVDRALVFEKQGRYPDARTMRVDVSALRVGAPPPYVTAIATGRKRAGEP